MSPEEIALANKGGRGFADLCDDVRRTEAAHLRACSAVERAEAQLKAAKATEQDALDTHEDALDALNSFITREYALTPEGE